MSAQNWTLVQAGVLERKKGRGDTKMSKVGREYSLHDEASAVGKLRSVSENSSVDLLVLDVPWLKIGPSLSI